MQLARAVSQLSGMSPPDTLRGRLGRRRAPLGGGPTGADDPRGEGRGKHVSSRWVWLSALALALLEAYLLIVLLFEETVFGIDVRLRHVALLVCAGFAVVFFALSRAARRSRISEGRLKDVALGASVLLVSLVGLDVLYTVYLNAVSTSGRDAANEVLDDAHILTREWIPLRYYPTEKAFKIHKPHFSNSVLVYGDLYHEELLELPEVASAVLRARRISNAVDEHGFRETTPLEESRIFALGDSFVFGVGVDQPDNWVEVLERKIGEPVYNLGVSGSGPRAHLLLLEYLLETNPDRLAIDRLLWLVFEGNDLEDGHPVYRPPLQGPGGALGGTIVQTLGYFLPKTLKEQSLLNRVRGGGVSWRSAGSAADAYVVDGVRLRAPLYRSEAFGPRLFFPPYVERAEKPRSYVLDHPNRVALEDTFEQMAALAAHHGFSVTILTAASAARQYGPRFAGFPPLSDQPYFIDFVIDLAHRVGFTTIDLYREMEPYARNELLFWRDDTHWNERGNEVVAGIVAERMATRSRAR